MKLIYFFVPSKDTFNSPDGVSQQKPFTKPLEIDFIRKFSCYARPEGLFWFSIYNASVLFFLSLSLYFLCLLLTSHIHVIKNSFTWT